MVDGYNRTIDYIRISVTERCNLRCTYCMPSEGVEWVEHNEILTYDEILTICNTLAKLGLKKIKLTGGEPLVRKGIATLITSLKNIKGIEEVTLTTNGVLLDSQIDDLVGAGLDAVNISLDTMDTQLYREITRFDKLDTVVESIKKACSYPNLKVKVNCVPVGSDRQNIVELVKLARDYNLSVRFIEMMPIGLGKEYEYISEERLKADIEEVYGKLTPYNKPMGNGPAHYYELDGFKGKLGFISAISHKYCDSCNRVRLTATGYLKTCLQYETGCDLKQYLRTGIKGIKADEDNRAKNKYIVQTEELEEAIKKAIFEKPKEHSFSNKEMQDNKSKAIMSQIGG